MTTMQPVQSCPSDVSPTRLSSMTKLPLALVSGTCRRSRFCGAGVCQDEGDAPAKPPAAGAPAAPGPPPTGPITTVEDGYLGLKNDVRYHPQVAYTRIQISPALHPVEGARLGIERYEDHHRRGQLQLRSTSRRQPTPTTPLPSSRRWPPAGERFAIVDLPGDMWRRSGRRWPTPRSP